MRHCCAAYDFAASAARPSLGVNVSFVCDLGRLGRAVLVALMLLHGAGAAAWADPAACADEADRPAPRAAAAAVKQAAAATVAPDELPAPYAAIVVDANAGIILHADKADELRHPASLTKMMTLYLLFEKLEAGAVRLDTQFPISLHASVQEPTKLDLVAGETVSVQDLILGLVTHSANDAAVVVAEALGGDEGTFAEAMTAKARALGMAHTEYRNASGLPDDAQVTTARDQAILGLALQRRFPAYYQYFSTRSFTRLGKKYRNHNHLLDRLPGMDGIKTGYIRSSKFNLVASVRRNDRHLVAVVLGGASARVRDARMRVLIEHYIVRATPKKTMLANARMGRRAGAAVGPASGNR